MHSYIRFLVLAALMAGFLLPRAQAADDDQGGIWATTYDRPAVEIGGFIADDGGSGEFNLLAPLVFSEGRDLFFLGADAKVSGFDLNDTGDTVFNVGGYLGYRSVLDDHGVLGLWAGLDHIRTEESNAFTRAIAGVEYFGPHMIARANAFIPLDSTSGEWTVTSGGFINTYDEKIPSGFDVEVGLRVPLAMNSLARPGEFRVFAGGYDFIGLDEDGGDVIGARARAELDLYPFEEMRDTRVSLEAGYAYDKHSGDQFSAGIKLAIPLGISNKIETSHGKDPDVVTLDSFGQDLFQPVRRNRDVVSRTRLKERRVAGAGTTGNFTLSRICGGSAGSLTLNAGLASNTIKQGALLGTIDPNGAATSLQLVLRDMVAPDGRTLEEILAPKPDVVRTTLKFATSTINFATQTVRPSAAVALASLAPKGQTITDATVTIDGNTCSLNLSVQPALAQGLTLASICGGKSSTISLNGGLVSSSIKQNARIGTIDPGGAATALNLDIARMVAPNGKTLGELLTPKPASLSSTFKFASVDFGTQSVQPAAAVALTSSLATQQTIKDATLTVNSRSCSLNLEIEETVPVAGLTLDTICGGPSANINLNSGLKSSAVKQGASLGIINPAGAATILKLDIAGMVSPGGQTLAQLLSSKPATLTSTFSFPASTVNFANQTVQPAATVALATGSAADQTVQGVTLAVNSQTCSLNLNVKANPPTGGLTLATICGGPSALLPMTNVHGVAMGASTIQQGDLIGTIDITGAATPVPFTLASMVDSTGTSLSQLLASSPATLQTTLFLPASVVVLVDDIVEPSINLANASVNVDRQRLLRFSVVVNSNSCSAIVKNGIKPNA